MGARQEVELGLRVNPRPHFQTLRYFGIFQGVC